LQVLIIVIGLSIFVQVMDTPGLFDTSQSHEDIAKRIDQAIVDLNPGPHVVLFVRSVRDRFTPEEQNTFDRLKTYFGTNFVDHMVVVYTHGDQLLEEGALVEDFLDHKKRAEEMKIIEAVGYRYTVFNNRRPSDDQVQLLVDLVESMGGSCYKAGGEYMHVVTQRVQEAAVNEIKKNPQFQQLQDEKRKAELQEKKKRLLALEEEEKVLNTKTKNGFAKVVVCFAQFIGMLFRAEAARLKFRATLFSFGLLGFWSEFGLRKNWKEKKAALEKAQELKEKGKRLIDEARAIERDKRAVHDKRVTLAMEVALEDTKATVCELFRTGKLQQVCEDMMKVYTDMNDERALCFELLQSEELKNYYQTVIIIIIIIIIIIKFIVSNREISINGRRSASAQLAEPGIEPRTFQSLGRRSIH
jgi:hypothetical protein